MDADTGRIVAATLTDRAVDVQDADGAGDLLRRVKNLCCCLEAVFADSVYNRLSMPLACFLLGLTLIVVRRIAGTGFVVLAQRWVVIARTMLPYQGLNGRRGSTVMNSADATGMMLPIPG
ncbi:hypothetical protein GGE65_008334 [Skermanella aerolata]|uniref:hypothetical protein n=1 Tax=Skermanella aerolata TaxID=393310 RepID=UPI003D227B6D